MSKITERLNSISFEAKTPNMEDIPSDVLEIMLNDFRKKEDEITSKIEQLGEELGEAKNKGKLVLIEQLRQEILSFQDEWNKIKEQINNITEILKYNHLEEKVLKKLGNEKNVLILEYIISTFTIATLLIIGIELFFKLSPQTKEILDIIDTLICLAFLIEFFWRMQFADSPWWYFKKNWLLFIASLPLAGILNAAVFFNLTQGLNILRLTRLIRLLRLLRGTSFLWRRKSKLSENTEMENQSVQPFIIKIFFIFLGRIFTRVQAQRIFRPLFLTIMIIFTGGLSIAYFDSGYNINVKDPLEGIWWSFTTVITKDFANIYNPQHIPGRIVTIILVLIGLILSSVLIGNLARSLLEDSTDRIERQQAILQTRLDDIMDKINKIDIMLK